MEQDKTPGAITWIDLTVQDADLIRDFYKQVVGWDTMDINMGGYSDYCMISPSDKHVWAGICHARGENANLPPSWIMYINVSNLDESISHVLSLGGEVIHGPRKMGEKARYCMIKDPAGAVCALFDHGQE
jgi:uncharacterized protein